MPPSLLASLQKPQILLLNIELELKSEKENAEVRLDDPEKYQSIVDAGELPACLPACLPAVSTLVHVCDVASNGGQRACSSSQAS
jgi:chaperonin GroEL (HSP60 family)